MCIKIAVTNEKGGCAKTTTAVNLAANLGVKGFKTLLVDMDYQAYATHYLGRYGEGGLNIFDVIKGRAASEVIQTTDCERLDLMPANHNFESGEEYLTIIKHQGGDFLPAIKTPFESIAYKYDFIIFDCPPNGVHIKAAVMHYVNHIIATTIPDDYAVQSLRCLSENLLEIKEHINPNINMLGILIVMFERNRNKIAYTEAIKNAGIFPCFDTAIRKNTTLSEAINAGEPINYYSKRSNGAKDYDAFADEVLAMLKGVK